MILSKEQLNEVIFSLVGSKEFVELWWTSSNRAFEGKTPKEVYETDKLKVQQYLLGFIR
jgi:hypothetical protein